MNLKGNGGSVCWQEALVNTGGYKKAGGNILLS